MLKPSTTINDATSTSASQSCPSPAQLPRRRSACQHRAGFGLSNPRSPGPAPRAVARLGVSLPGRPSLCAPGAPSYHVLLASASPPQPILGRRPYHDGCSCPGCCPRVPHLVRGCGVVSSFGPGIPALGGGSFAASHIRSPSFVSGAVRQQPGPAPEVPQR